MGAPPNGLDDTYNPACVAPDGFLFEAAFAANGTVEGQVSKVCEADLLRTVGDFF